MSFQGSLGCIHDEWLQLERCYHQLKVFKASPQNRILDALDKPWIYHVTMVHNMDIEVFVAAVLKTSSQAPSYASLKLRLTHSQG